MKETINLKLKKPDSGDPVLVSDLNENADTLDTAVASKLDKSGGTLTGPVTINGGDNQGIIMPEDGNINAPGNRTVMGFLSGVFTVNNPAYSLNFRGSAARPLYNGEELALKSDTGGIDPTVLDGKLDKKGGVPEYSDNPATGQARAIHYGGKVKPTASDGKIGDIWITDGDDYDIVTMTQFNALSDRVSALENIPNARGRSY